MRLLASTSGLLSSRSSSFWSWAILACLLIFVAAVRLRLLDVPLERDEGEFAYGGQLLLKGIMPGELLYTMKLSGTHAAYALFLALFGQSGVAVHFGFLLLNSITIVAMFLAGRAFAGQLAGVAAAAVYGLMSLSASTLGTAAHATHFVVLCATSGLLLLHHASQKRRLAWFFAGGVLLGSSVLMKHNGIFFVGLGLGWLLWLTCLKRDAPVQTRLQCCAVFLLGLAAPVALLCLVLWFAGTFENTWFWSVSYAGAYAKPNPGGLLIWRILRQRMPEVMQLPFYASCCGVAILWLSRSSWKKAAFGTAILGVSIIAVIPGLHFRPHYYVLLMPGVALLLGTLAGRITDLLRTVRINAGMPFIPALVLSGWFLGVVARERAYLFQLTPSQVCVSLYGSGLFVQARVVADQLREHSSPEARVAVIGSEPEIYFYAQRLSATGYIYTYPLVERQPFAAEMREQMAHEVKAAMPDLIVQVRHWTSWRSRPGSPEGIAALCDSLMPTNYSVVGACSVDLSGTGARWFWITNLPLDAGAMAPDLMIFRKTPTLSYPPSH